MTGHNMLGLMLAPATGRLVTGLLTGKPNNLPIPSSPPAEPSGGARPLCRDALRVRRPRPAAGRRLLTAFYDRSRSACSMVRMTWSNGASTRATVAGRHPR